jgi:hypothetical protein
MDSPVMSSDPLPVDAEDPDDISLLSPPSTPPPSSRPIDSAISLVDSLLAFYHQERMWVYRTRASLELVLEAAPSGASDSTLISTSESTATVEEKKGSLSIVVHPHDNIGAVPIYPINSPTTLWMRRKKSFKLKLEGISMRSRKRRTITGQEAPHTPGVQMLELFENMMEARMESCERVSRMLREANSNVSNL